MTGPNSPRSDETPKELFARVSEQLSRRQLMGNAAKAGVGAMALGAFGAGTAAADDHEGGKEGEEMMDEPSVADIVNYALTLERLEAAYYEGALASSGGVFDERDIEGSHVAKAFGAPTLRYSTYQELEDVRDHELYHVTALEGVLDQIGAEDNAATEFSLPDGVYDSVENFVSFAAVVENLGVAAYAGAAPALAKAELALVDGDTSKLQVTPAALGIHSIEARHASLLRTLNRQRPWLFGENVDLAEQSIDQPKTMEEVLAVAGEYIVE